MIRRLALLFLIAFCAIQSGRQTVRAHPVPFSYLDLRFDEEKIEGTLVAHIVDLAHDLEVTPPESLLDPGVAESKKRAIAELIQSRLILVADGQPVKSE